MHYLHLVIVNAESCEDACSVAEELIPQNNTYDYFEICGAVSKNKGKIYSTGEGRFCPKEILKEEANSVNFIKDAGDKKAVTLKKLDDMFKGWKSTEYEEKKLKDFKNTFNKLLKNEPVDSFNVYCLKDFVEHHYQVCKEKDVDVWGSNFYSHIFDSSGVTNLAEGIKDLYCVFVDFHN